MSLDQLGSKSYALRNLWEATLFDEKHNPMDWTTGLMVSTNIPKLKFIVESILSGSSKGYRGWELPDALSIVMRETSDHSLEKYLDEWMTGKTGVFNPESGAFRMQDSADFLYRNVRVRTFYYKYTSGESINVKIHEAIQRGVDDYIMQISSETKKVTGTGLSSGAQGYLQDQAYTAMSQEYVKVNPVLTVEKKQVIPLVDKLTALAGGVVNQLVSKVPLSNLTRAIIPPLVIPPPLLRIPVATGSPPPIPRHLKIPVKLGSPAFSEEIRKVSVDTVQKTSEKIVEITGGAASNAMKWKAEGVTTALVTYTCAIEGYDIGTYDYQTGDGVQYTINLPVCDIKIEHET
jgi:hypothetical protein